MTLLKPRKPAAQASAPTPATSHASDERLMRLAEVMDTVGLGKSSIYNMIREGRFPAQYRYGVRVSLWKFTEVQAYVRGEWKPLHTMGTVLKLVGTTKGGAV